jgi:hypothetical protein
MKKYIISFIFIVIVSLPCSVFAANVYFEAVNNDVSVGDIFIINVKIDSDNVDINSVDGDIAIESNKDNLVVKDFNLVNSVFSIWPEEPTLSKDGNNISFVGGTPGGFNKNKETLFNIIVEAKKEGNIILKLKNMTIFANNGKGTAVSSTLKGTEIKISPKKDEINNSVNEWDDVILRDKTSPENFVIEIGRDNSLFDGKRFAFFNAMDNQSGINYYEVSENGGPFFKNTNMYVLQNQDEKIKPVLSVIAYDKAGNKTISVYNKESRKNISIFSLIVILISIIITTIVFVFRKINKNK